MEISSFLSDKDTKATRHTLSWEQLCAALADPARRSPKETPKNRLPMWSPATFRGDKRASANVEKVSLLVFDVDEVPIPTLEEIGMALGDIRWFAHSSANSSWPSPRWRMIIELSRPVTAEEHGRLWKVWVERLPFAVGKASKDAGRAWYAPRSGDDDSFMTSEQLKGQLAATV